MAYKAGFHLLGLSLCLLAYQKMVMPMCGYETQEKGFAEVQRKHGVEEGVGKAKERAEKAEQRIRELEAELEKPSWDRQKVNKLDIQLRKDKNAVEAAKDFEKDYQVEAERLIKACASAGEKVPKTEDGNTDLGIFKQTWKAANTVPAVNVTDDNKIRVVQFNTLAHGLSGQGSGFGTYYNLDKINKLMGRLLLSGEMKPGLTGDVATDWKQFGLVDDAKYGASVLRPEPIRELLYSKTWGQTEKTTEKGYAVPARIKRLIALVLEQKADIITLQEVDHYDYMEGILNFYGYEGKFQAKITSPGIKNTGNGRGAENGCDGVATFWKSDRFELVDKNEETRFALPLVIATKLSEGAKIKSVLDKFIKSSNKVLKILKGTKHSVELVKNNGNVDKDSHKFNHVITRADGSRIVKEHTVTITEKNLALFDFRAVDEHTNIQAKQVAMKVTLKTKVADSKEFTVFCGHFKSGEKAEDKAVKPYHTDYFNDAVNSLIQDGKNVIIGCDFNTAMETKAFKKFEEKFIENDHDTGFQQTMWSSYNYKENDARDLKGNPKPHADKWFTASKWRRGGTQPDKCKLVEQIIDYIFHSKQFKTLSTLTVPTSGEVAKKSPLRLPCWQYPSDHFMIGADLVLV